MVNRNQIDEAVHILNDVRKLFGMLNLIIYAADQGVFKRNAASGFA